MGIWERISQQLSNPAGPGGRVVAALMNRGNREMNLDAIARLELGEGRRALDLGFGGGLALAPLLETGADVTGLDRSEDMVERARRAHAAAIEAGRLRLVTGDVAQLPFEDGAFDGVLTVNTVYFWPDLPAALREVRRVISPGGRLVIGLRDPAVMRRVSRDIFTVRDPADVAAAAEEAGYAGVRLESPPGRRVHFVTAGGG